MFSGVYEMFFNYCWCKTQIINVMCVCVCVCFVCFSLAYQKCALNIYQCESKS